MAKRISKEIVLKKAEEIVYFYSATLRPDDKSQVRKGTMKHIDGIEEEGYWVTCKLFVPKVQLEGD